MGNTAYKWCPLGCGKKVIYIGKSIITKVDKRWFCCNKCKKKYKKEELG